MKNLAHNLSTCRARLSAKGPLPRVLIHQNTTAYEKHIFCQNNLFSICRHLLVLVEGVRRWTQFKFINNCQTFVSVVVAAVGNVAIGFIISQ
jgi:hypothetical protein